MDKIYTASRTTRAGLWRDMRANGFDIISSWIDEAEAGQTDDLSELWDRILMEVATCDRMVVYALNEDFPLKGALIEAGMGIGLDKRITVCLPGVTLEERSFRPIGSWINHPLVKREDDLLRALKGI